MFNGDDAVQYRADQLNSEPAFAAPDAPMAVPQIMQIPQVKNAIVLKTVAIMPITSPAVARPVGSPAALS